MRTLDSYLSRLAQTRLHPSALVYREPDGTYTLERDGHTPLGLGEAHGTAQGAIRALAAALRAREP